MKFTSKSSRALLVCSLLFMGQPAICFPAVHVAGDKPVKKNKSPARENGPAPSVAFVVERLLSRIEENIVRSAEAMPEGKFNFTPEDLNINGSDFKGVRSFAGQIKHLATDNLEIWSPVSGEKVRGDISDVNGPESIRTKAQIIQYLKESFALGHKVIATLTRENAFETVPFRGNMIARLDLAFYALTHANEHYGQMAVYLRLCGIVPPASRTQ